MRCPITAVAAAGARTALESGLVGILDLADLCGLPAFAPGETVEVAVVRVAPRPDPRRVSSMTRS